MYVHSLLKIPNSWFGVEMWASTAVRRVYYSYIVALVPPFEGLFFLVTPAMPIDASLYLFHAHDTIFTYFFCFSVSSVRCEPIASHA